MEVDLNAWTQMFLPLLRLLAGLAMGLLLANFLEAMRLGDYLARLAMPLARLAHMGGISAASFALAFMSPSAANGLLSENLQKGLIGKREAVLANLLNSLPAFFSHAPTMLLLLWPALGFAALLYVGITFAAALGRLLFTMILGSILLPLRPCDPPETQGGKENSLARRLQNGLGRAWSRFRKRLPPLIFYTTPFYFLVYFCQRHGLFEALESWLATNLEWLTFLKPQAMSLMALQLVAETGASLGAASAFLQEGSLSAHDIVLAMLAGNVLATPIRAIRHQFPAYAGFYGPSFAALLVVANQGLRALSMVLVIAIYLGCQAFAG